MFERSSLVAMVKGQKRNGGNAAEDGAGIPSDPARQIEFTIFPIDLPRPPDYGPRLGCKSYLCERGKGGGPCSIRGTGGSAPSSRPCWPGLPAARALATK